MKNIFSARLAPFGLPRGRRGTHVASTALLAVLFSSTSTFADSLNQRWGPWVGMGGRFSDSRTAGEADLFAPVWQNPNSLLFFDIRGNFGDGDTRSGNFGVGYRHMLDNGWNLGVYGYLDVGRSPLGNTFYQSTIGVEALSNSLDFRANAYLPLGSRQKRMDVGSWSNVATTAPEAVLTGTELGIQRIVTTSLGTNYLVERAMAGFDAEVGVRLPVFPDHPKLDFRAFAGGYHFEADGMEDISGPRARLELTARDFAGMKGVRLTGGLAWQDDKVRGSQLIASIGLRVPFNPGTSSGQPLSYMEDRMTDPVTRDVDILTGSRAESVATSTTIEIQTEQAINSWNNEVVTSVTNVSGSAGPASLQGELDARGVGSVVVLNGNVTTTASVAVNAGQTLLGGGTALRVRGAETGVEVDYVAAGDQGSIIGNATAPGPYTGLVLLPSKSVLGGLTVQSTGGGTFDAAVLAYQADGAVAFNNTVVGANRKYGHGILYEESTNGIVTGNTITTQASPGTFGVVFYNGSTGSIDNNIFNSSDPFSAGVLLELGDNRVVIKDNTFNPHPLGSVIYMNGGTILPGSTGNAVNGPYGQKCVNFGATDSGTIEFTDGSSCTFP